MKCILHHLPLFTQVEQQSIPKINHNVVRKRGWIWSVPGRHSTICVQQEFQTARTESRLSQGRTVCTFGIISGRKLVESLIEALQA